MDSARYQHIKRVFLEAAAQEGEARTQLLDRRCGDDAELRREVERLLDAASVATGSLAPGMPSGAPERCGPYRIGRELGHGGMGVVYEAVDTRDGARVAVKLMHPFVRASGRLRREAQLGLVVEHENLVRTLDWGEAEGRPYIAMEFVEGRTLRELADELGRIPEALLREIAAQVSAGLEAMHGAGVVHRDLKPENLCITADDVVRIMDLGIAKVLEATVELTTPGQFLGSLRYASPEQCDGSAVGAASDLYSLGVVLYELATGENPFHRDLPAATLEAQRRHRPAPARERNPALSAFFSDVLEALLRKNPKDRIGTARELSAILREGETGAWWKPRPAERPEIFVRRDTAMHGRAAELARLREAWDRARAGQGSALLVQGEAGLGKTRLIDEFLRSVATDAHVLVGSFPPTGGMDGLCDAVTGHFSSTALADDLRRHVPEALADRFAAFLAGVPGPLRDDLLQSAFSQLIGSLAAQKPVLWICDDLHFAPRSARQIVRAMARAARDRAVLLVATSREAESGLDTMRLEPLADDDVDRIVRELRPAASDRVAAPARGVPYFILEIARAPEDERVPEAVRDLIAARLQGLGRNERALLDVAAIQGAEFDAEPVAQALDRPVVAVLQDLAEIERGPGLVRSAGRRFAFDHHLVREAVYEQIPELLRAEYHGLLARAIAGPASALATHHLRSRTPEAGLPILDEALDELRARHLDEEARDLIERALPLVEGAVRAQLLLRKLTLLDRAADRVAQRETVDLLRDLTDRLGDPALQATAHERAARLFWSIGREQDALDQYRAAGEFARAAGDEKLQAHTLNLVGVTLQHLGRPAAALAVLADARDLARRTDNPGAEMIALSTIAAIHRRQGRLEEAMREFEEAEALDAEPGGDRAYVRLGHAQLLLRLGRFAEARSRMEEHVREGVESGDRRQQAIGLVGLGLLQMDTGELAESLDSLSRAFRLQLEVESRRGLTVTQLDLGELYNLLGDFEQADVYLDAAYEGSGDDAMRHVRASVHDARGRRAEWSGGSGEEYFAKAAEGHVRVGDRELEARSRLRIGQLDRAIALAEENGFLAVRALAAALARDRATAERLLDESGDLMDTWYRLETTWLVGRRDEARAMLDRIVQRAPEAYRESMVRNVPLFRAIADATATRPGS